MILEKTPFYAESGGQIGDIGTIKGADIDLRVLDVKKENESFLHICKGTFSEGEGQVDCIVNDRHRNSVKKNHTATHLMHKALKSILGDHVNQAGSLVHSDYLRFDLTHFEKITSQEIKEFQRFSQDFQSCSDMFVEIHGTNLFSLALIYGMILGVRRGVGENSSVEWKKSSNTEGEKRGNTTVEG